uniref:dUTPase-like domain-containing protein n=1 Tax=Anser brachyrhynchus TaxID=132585 RepID=A0A8B9BZJ3_9AVES
MTEHRSSGLAKYITVDSLTAKTRGSAGLDVSTVEDCTLWDTRVCKIMLNIKGPIGKGYSTLLLGCSSTTLTGLFVLPGVIDADYEGVIQAMAWTPSPLVLVPKDTRIAQLILFKATVPQAEQCEQRDRGFGSTGSSSVFWASTIATKRPILTLT